MSEFYGVWLPLIGVFASIALIAVVGFFFGPDATYHVRIWCNNCQCWRGAFVRKGTPQPESGAKCWECGCCDTYREKPEKKPELKVAESPLPDVFVVQPRRIG